MSPLASLPRQRAWLAVGALVCLAVLVALSLVVVTDLTGLSGLDNRLGTAPELYSYHHPLLVRVLLGIEIAFSTIPMAVATAVTAALLLWRRHLRTAAWTIGVMVGASVTTTVFKLVLHRHRPTWTEPVQVLRSYSFPSGHASAIASAAGVAIVLAVLLLHRRWPRALVTVVAIALVILVGLDRVFLGVHNPSDVIAGYAVGGLWALGSAVLFDPGGPRPARAPSASGVASRRQLHVVLNPIRVADVAGFQRRVEQQVQATEWSAPVWHLTTVEDPGRGMAERAAADAAELVLVVGGDGTVRTVCAALAGTGVSVGIVPAGTGNLLARNLGIPLRLHAAVDAALTGEDRVIDLARVTGDGIAEGQHFLVMAGMGFDAAIMAGANEWTKARMGWLAYVASAARHLMFAPVRLEVSIDGAEPTHHRARTVVVGNVGNLQAGMPLLPDAVVDDGLLDVVLLNPRGVWSWLPLALRVFRRGRRTDQTLTRMTGRTVSIRAHHDTVRQLDGDAIGTGRELHAECLHGRLLVRVPRRAGLR